MSWDLDALLTAVRDRLKDQVAALGNRAFVGVDENDFPAEASTPLATVWDAGGSFGDPDNQEVLTEFLVGTSVFVQNLRDTEAPILGDAAGAPGVQELLGSVITALKDQTLGLSVWALVRPVEHRPTRTWIDTENGGVMVQKSLVWRYRQKPSI